MSLRKLKSRIIVICCLIFPAVSYAELQISDAWIRDMPPTVSVRAGYLTIHNPESSPLKIVAIESKAFKKIEIHQTIEQDGTMRMERVLNLNIPANSTLPFAPGGLHLMMMQPVESIDRGVNIQITLIFEDGDKQSIELVVKK